MSKQTAEIGRMLQTRVIEIVDHGVVHIVYAALYRSYDTAAAYDDRKRFDIDSYVLKLFLDEPLAPLELVEDRRELSEFFGCVSICERI